MRVLQVIPSVSMVHGGPSRAIRAMESALARRGVEVETVTTDDEGTGRRNGIPDGGAIEENGVLRRYFRKRTEFYKVAPGMARWLSRNIQNYDLVHIHALFSFSSTMAASAARRQGVPYIVRPLGVLNRYGIENRRPGLKRLSLRYIEGPILREAAAIHFTAWAEREEVSHLGIAMRRAAVIPLGVVEVDPNVPPLGSNGEAVSPARERRLLFLSRLDPIKNIEGLLSAFRQVLDRMPEARLSIAGSGQEGYVAALQAQAKSLGIQDRVDWLGYVEGAAKQAVMRAADLFVLPSFSENFGIAAVEALAAGLPCVLGQGVAIAEDVAAAQAGVAVAPKADAIAEGILAVMAGRERWHAMALNAMQLARERYSVGAMSRALAALYEEILTDGGQLAGDLCSDARGRGTDV